jgi:hypothetical protein
VKYKFPITRLKVSRLDFLGWRLPPHWLPSKGSNYQRGVLRISSGASEGYFERKPHSALSSRRGSFSCTTRPQLTGHLQPRRNWPTWASSVLKTHPILRIWPCWTTVCSLGWKKTFKRSPFCVRRGGHCCRGDLVVSTNFWFFFFDWVVKVRKTG